MPYGFFSGGGKMGKAVSDNDWSNHALGDIDGWPQTLKSTLSICLHSPFPMAIYWGKDMHLLYNDAWTPILGDKHPEALGQSAHVVWSDIWNVIGPAMKNVLHSGVGTIAKENLLPLYRRGYIEEAYFDYTINPIYGENQTVEGLLLVANEVTPRILTERRNTILHKLSQISVTAESAEAACIIAANTLGEAPYDIAFARLYLINDEGTHIRLAADTSIDDTNRMHLIDLADGKRILPYAEVIKRRKSQVVHNVDQAYKPSRSIWTEPPRHIVMLPIVRSIDDVLYGLMVVGISPRLFYDQAYDHFLKDTAERVAFSIGNALDVRDKGILADREQQAREQLRAALSSGLIGVWSWDVINDRLVTDANMADLFGIARHDAYSGLVIEKFIQAIHPDDRQRLRKKIEHSLLTHEWLEDEYRIVSKDNGTRWVLARGNVEIDTDGSPVRLPGVVVDITERKKAEEELANSERIFKSLFDSNILGMAVASLDGTIHEVNNVFLRMLGYTRKEFSRGMTSGMITPKNSTRATEQIYKSLKQTGEAEPVNKTYVTKSGKIIPVVVGAVMMAGDDGKFISFILDLSEQAHLRELNKAKDEFISIASHQLRTPATGVKQYLGMLLEGYAGEISDRQRSLLKTAYASNERQLVIVNDLLRVAQADAKEVQLNREEVDLVKLVQDILDEQSVKFQSKQQPIEFLYTKKRIVALVDPFYMRMAIENIVDNAHKYTPQSKIISVSLRTIKNKEVEIKISDQGVGIKKRDMPKLFKKFSRIDNPLSMEAGGTGLGLYWVKRIITLHRGEISATSTYHKGTTFVITLPNSIHKTPRRRPNHA